MQLCRIGIALLVYHQPIGCALAPGWDVKRKAEGRQLWCNRSEAERGSKADKSPSSPSVPVLINLWLKKPLDQPLDDSTDI